MASTQLPFDSFPAWAHLHDVTFDSVAIKDVSGKGYGLVAQRGFGLNVKEGNRSSILRVPADLVLSATAVDEYAKVDQNFNALLEVSGVQSARYKILLYLLSHLISNKQKAGQGQRCVATPWSEYIKFLPAHIPVPTMWKEADRLLLRGTSLENALDAKLAALNTEFNQLQEVSSNLPFWNSLFWEHGSATITDWILVDAWYRSRCLELPRAGTAMVPALDMVNHSAAPSAYYDEEPDGTMTLQIHPSFNFQHNAEVCISYGKAKPAAEMLFSWGFIDKESSSQKLTLPIEPFSDDPLAKAKLHIYHGSPTVSFALEGAECRWTSPFVYLMCLNEEDGVEFCVLQDSSGGRQLRLFWQEKDVTDTAGDFEELMENHPLRALFKLRAVAVLQEAVADQVEKLESAPGAEQLEPLIDAEIVERNIVEVIAVLKGKEAALLSAAASTLGLQKQQLLDDEAVVAYLDSTVEPQNDQVASSPTNGELDFS